MAKFIELDAYDIMKGQPEGKRVINVDTVKELSSHTIGVKEITRVHLGGKDFIDIADKLQNVKSQIESA